MEHSRGRHATAAFLTRHQRHVGHWEIDENRAIDTASHL